MYSVTTLMKGNRNIALFFLLSTILVYGAYIINVFQPYTFLHADQAWMYFTVKSLVEDGDLDLRNQLHNNPAVASDQTALGKRGEWYPLHEYLMAVLAVPFYILLYGAFGCLVFNFVISVTIAMVAFGLCLRHSSPRIAFMSACLTAFSPVLVHYCYGFSLDGFGTLLIGLAYWVAVRRRPFWTGVLLAIAIFGRMANVFTLPAFILFFMLDHEGFENAKLHLSTASLKATFFFLLGVMPVALCLLASNYLMFGTPFETSYHHWLIFNTGSGGFKVMSQSTAFTRPFLKGLKFNILDKDQGLYAGAPLLIIALVCGLPSFWKKAKSEALLWTIACASIIIAFSKYKITYAAFGNRYLMSVVLLGAVPFAHALRNILEPDEPLVTNLTQ